MLATETMKPLTLEYGQGVPAPQWMKDGFEDYKEYERKTVCLVKDFYAESKEKFGSLKVKNWKRADRLANLEHVINEASAMDAGDTRLPTMIQAIEEYMSSRLDESLMPTAVSREQAMDPFVQTLNYAKDEVLDDNRYQFLRMRLRLDQLRFRIGFIYCGVDPNKQGLFGFEGKHVLDRIDPRCIWPDPYAQDWRFDSMRYLIIARPMDITEIAKCWPDKAHRLVAEPGLSPPGRNTGDDGWPDQELGGGGFINFQGDSVLGYNVGSRGRALVLEAYVRDGRVRKEPRGYYSDGSPWRNDEGEIIARYVDRYPTGRKIVVCGNILLEDRENPYCEAPITAYPESPYPGLFSFSPLEAMDISDRKQNRLAKSMFNNLEVNMDSPIIVSNKAFLKQSQYENMKAKPGQAWVVRDNTTLKRLEPGVMPPETLNVINFFKDQLDGVLGVTDVSRGNLQAGTELSAQTLQDAQGSQMKRQRLKGEMDKEAMQQLGKQLFHNIRKWLPSDMTVNVKNPATGADETLRWSSAEWKNNWTIKIEVGSSSPGAKQSFEQQAVTLYKEGVVDAQYARDALKIAPDVSKRIEDKRLELAQAGLPEMAMQYPKKSKAGRRSQTPLL